MKRRWSVVVGLAALVLVLVVWRWRAGGSDADQATKPIVAANVATDTPSTASTKRPDPRTLKRGSIAGMVRTEAKLPIAGATVCADITADELPTELTRDATCVTTDANGAFAFTNLLAGKYSVDAGAKTYRPATFHPDGNKKKDWFPLAAGEAKTGVDFVLREGGVEVTGIVSDISGGPIAHAKVRANSGRWGQGASTPVSETDDKGAFSIWTAPGQVEVSASADGYAGSSESGRAPGVFELLLTPESSLSGTVVDARTGTPIEGAKVHVSPAQWRYGEGGGSERTDAQGKFRVNRITPGRYTATARTEHGYGTTEGSTLVGLGQQVDGVIVKLFPAAKIVGKVMIAGDKPTVCIEGWASFNDEARDRQIWGRTDPDGTLTVEGVLPGTYKVTPSCDGYQARDSYDPIIIADKDAIGLEWIVEAGATIKGKVLTTRGEPIEDANVNGRTVGGAARSKSDWSGGTSERDGSYEMTGLRTASYKLDVTSDKAVAPRDGYTVEVTGGKTIEKDLILEDGGTLKGTVVDAQGTPVEGVSINARPLIDSMQWWGAGNVKSDAKGAFTIDALRPGDYRVTAQRSWSDQLKKPGTTDDAKQGEKTTVRAAQTATVKLVVESQTGIIKGMVVAPDGTPVSDAFISTARESDAAGAQDSSMGSTRGWGWGDSDKPVLTGTDGTFVVTKLSPGKYTLRAYRKGGGEAIAEHVAVGSTTRLEIKDTGSITGLATRAGGTLEELTVSIQDLKTGFERTEQFFRTDGRFVLKDLPAGHFHLTASAAGGNKKIELDLAHAEAKTGVTVALEELVTLTGRIVEHGTKKPVAGMRMHASLAQGGSGMSFRWGGDEDRDNISDDSGTFTVKRAPRGKLQIMGMHK
ncbi:MAG: carboxypeptidase regulatory-like domain-containing protein, partial [Deltaproteobacteria bacterium]|nr:carboxypeptidase regulatory-like domain-containing protein [Deltaproteobacteria bacterium]